MKKIIFIFGCLAFAGSLIAQNTIERKTYTYSVKDGKELLLDTYTDSSVAFEGKRPVMIYVHGGGFSNGSRINALQIRYCKHFVAKGFVAVAINYRLGIKEGAKPEEMTDDHIMKAVSMACEDLFDATAFIIANAGEWNIDPGKIIISGGSAGAITCLTAEYLLCSGGGPAGTLPADFNYAGIISHAGCVIVPGDTLIWEKTPCPMLLMHGSVDNMVPFDTRSGSGSIYGGSNYLHRQFTALGLPHWLYEEAGADHIVALKPLQHNFGETDTFIEKFVLEGKHAIVHTVWADEKPDSMNDMMKVVPWYIMGWEKTDDEMK